MTSLKSAILSCTIFGFFSVIAVDVQAKLGCSRPIKIAVEYPRQNVVDHPRITAHQSSRMLFDFFDQVGEKSNCQFEWIVVPRARGLLYFQDGTVDMIYAAQTDKRDQLGHFVRLFDFRVSLIVLKEHFSDAVNLNDLAQSNLQFNFVRGYDYGPAYLELKAALEKKKRAEEVADTETIARKMKVGRAHATIMAGTIFVAPAQESDIVDKIAVISLPQLGRRQSGVYLSRGTLAESDRRRLQGGLEEVAKLYKFRDFIESSYPKWSTKGFIVDEVYGASKP